MGQAPQQHDVDPEALLHAERGWWAFGLAAKIAVTGIALVLVLMAVFLL